MERKTNVVAGYSLFARTFVCVENRLKTELLYADCTKEKVGTLLDLR
jgi:hypothetical protein